jgi:hypothetical protein
MKAATFLLTALAIVMVGCGGGGASVGDPSTAGGTAGNGHGTPAGNVRRNVDGDTYNYSVGGTYTESGTPANTPASGTGSEVFTADTFNGNAALEDSVSWTLNLVSGPKAFSDIRQYDPSWQTVGQSDMGTVYVVQAQGQTIPGNLTANTTFNSVEILSNGTHVTIAGQVTGSETITVPAGTFKCWIIDLTKTWSDGLTVHQTIDFSGDLGAAAQVVQTDTYTSGYSDSVTWTLTSDHITLTP